MIKRIAVAVDFSAESERATHQALNLARHLGAELVLVHVCYVPELGELDEAEAEATSVKRLKEAIRKDFGRVRARLDDVRESVSGQGVEVSQTVIDAFPDTGICKAAVDLGADLTIVGTRGRTGVKRFLLGSVAERVTRLSEGPVLIARGEVPARFRRILVPTDFSAPAERALALATELAEADAEIHLVHFWHFPADVSMPAFHTSMLDAATKEIEESAVRRGREAIDRYRKDGCSYEIDVVCGHAANATVERAAGYDLIAMGSHGRRGLRRLLLGSVAEVTVRHAPCSVLIAHGED